MSDPKLLKVRVRNTEDIIFEGEVDRVTSLNEVGRFDVFPLHANFISIIRGELSFYHKREKVKELKFEQGVMKVKKDEVHIFLGIELLYIDEEENSPKVETKKK